MWGTYDPPERNDDQKNEVLKAGEEVSVNPEKG
jgi:hypothetical protein